MSRKWIGAAALALAGSCTNGSVTASQYFATENFWAPGSGTSSAS